MWTASATSGSESSCAEHDELYIAPLRKTEPLLMTRLFHTAHIQGMLFFSPYFLSSLHRFERGLFHCI